MGGVYTPVLGKNTQTRATAKNTSAKKHNDLVISNVVEFDLEEDFEFENELPEFLGLGEIPIGPFHWEKA